jgi:Tfp pilus assembly protein PilN
VSQQINLFNPIFLRQEKQFSAVAMAQGLGVISVAVLGFASFSTYQSVQVSKDAAVASAALKSTQEQLVKMVDKTKPAPVNKQIEEDIQKAESRLRASQQILGFVQNGEFKSSQSYSSFLRAFSNKAMPGVWLTGFSLSDGGNDIEITGRALQPGLVPAYIKSLKSESAFAGKSFGSMLLRSPQTEAVQKATADVSKALPAVRYIDFSLNSSEAVQGAIQAMGTTNR